MSTSHHNVKLTSVMTPTNTASCYKPITTGTINVGIMETIKKQRNTIFTKNCFVIIM